MKNLAPNASATEIRKEIQEHATDLTDKSDSTHWHNSDFSLVFIERTRIAVPPALRDMLRALSRAHKETLTRKELIQTVIAQRGGAPEDFRPERILKSYAAKELIRAGLLHVQHSYRETIYWLNPPKPQSPIGSTSA